MLCRSQRERRRGAALVETAIVLPLTFLPVIGLVVGAMGISRLNQVAELARATARFAATKGTQFELENGKTYTKQQIIDAVITPRAASLTPLTVEVKVILPDGTAIDWDDSYWAGPPQRNKTYTVTTDYGALKINRVRVKLTYQWMPEIALVGPFTLTSTSEQVMSY